MLVPGAAVLAPKARQRIEAALPEGFVVSGRQAAFAAGHVLGLVEAVRIQVAPAAHLLARPFGAVGVGAIDDYGQIVGLCESAKLVNLRRVAAKVNRHNRPGARRDGGGHRRRIETKRVGIDVGKDHVRTDVHGRKRCGHKRKSRDDHFIAGPNVEGAQADVQARGATCQRDPKRGVVVIAEACVEFHNHRPMGRAAPTVALQHLVQEFLLPLIVLRPGRELCGTHRRAAADCELFHREFSPRFCHSTLGSKPDACAEVSRSVHRAQNDIDMLPARTVASPPCIPIVTLS